MWVGSAEAGRPVARAEQEAGSWACSSQPRWDRFGERQKEMEDEDEPSEAHPDRPPWWVHLRQVSPE